MHGVTYYKHYSVCNFSMVREVRLLILLAVNMLMRQWTEAGVCQSPNGEAKNARAAHNNTPLEEMLRRSSDAHQTTRLPAASQSTVHQMTGGQGPAILGPGRTKKQFRYDLQCVS